MTKSRSALTALAAIAFWPGAAHAWPAAPIAIPGIMSAPSDPLGEVARRVRLGGDSGCVVVHSGDELVVCGRRRIGGSLRVPDEPEPGARMRLTAGELPSAMAAMNAGGCLRLCHQPVMIDIIGTVRAVQRGLDRILHPD